MSSPPPETGVSMRAKKETSSKPEAEIAWGNRIAIALVVVTFIAALTQILTRGQHQGSGHIVLSLAHWQLEPGITDGFEYMAKRYNEERVKQGLEEIEFKQLPIPEGGYGQFVTTQLMGGTAPDLIEMGLGLNYETFVRYHAYYMVPVTAEILKPNPYNKGTDVENEKWKNTFIDGMGPGITELQEYYDIGLSTFCVRLFFNEGLLKEVTQKLADAGKLPAALDKPPADFRKFLELCDLIAELKDDRGRPYLPLGGGQYQFGIMNGQIVDPLTAGLLPDVDENMDCNVGNDETLMAVLEHRVTFDDPRVYRVMELSANLAKRFPPGYTGLTRDDGVMQFVQWRSVFIATGSWDGSTLRKQAEEAARPFKVGVARFPLIQKTDPEWGDLAWGRPFEAPSMGFPFALTKNCTHPEVALDFLRFITSQKGNEEFNRVIGWIPTIKGSTPAPELADFKPNFYGIRAGWNANMGSKSQTITDRINPELQLGQDKLGAPFGIDRWRHDMDEQWLPNALIDFQQHDETMRDKLPSAETVAALLRARMLLGNEPQAYFSQRYLDGCWNPLTAPRNIAYSQKRLQEAKERGAAK